MGSEAPGESAFGNRGERPRLLSRYLLMLNQEDDLIPVRAKKGVKSKKQLRDEVGLPIFFRSLEARRTARPPRSSSSCHKRLSGHGGNGEVLTRKDYPQLNHQATISKAHRY